MVSRILLTLLLAAPVVSAQAPSVPVHPYTETESLRIENTRLEAVIVQRALSDWQAKVAKLKADLEAARPGWTWNPESGAWTAVPPAK